MERAAIITGGSSGIGLAIARMLRDEGYNLTRIAAPEKVEAAAAPARSPSRQTSQTKRRAARGGYHSASGGSTCSSTRPALASRAPSSIYRRSTSISHSA
jgi:NAD(P)-dependent dehydrogenase (short-subunit alcohol dehydrogenase family)